MIQAEALDEPTSPVFGDEHSSDATKTENTQDMRGEPTSQTVPEDADPAESDHEQTQSGDESDDPSMRIDDFDWTGLEATYQSRMEQAAEEEGQLYQEFNHLIEFFGIWASTIQNHEEERSAKRLKTRVFHVENSEAELEKKRQHYIKVVNAFQSALALLNG
ncbi:hypothetical protein NA57DRAFT_48715 [Rhizodiscina lignyota]|uniref:Uncharacterized protein n=1 Tax=Rhizodiscina lignyota TaxID=1504668 RepID=A0A9P4M144_9PEZI|nr:hypothetical protein NA57DRAFT_48715 [Rhizodiscina lignyota]